MTVINVGLYNILVKRRTPIFKSPIPHILDVWTGVVHSNHGLPRHVGCTKASHPGLASNEWKRSG